MLSSTSLRQPGQSMSDIVPQVKILILDRFVGGEVRNTEMVWSAATDSRRSAKTFVGTFRALMASPLWRRWCMCLMVGFRAGVKVRWPSLLRSNRTVTRQEARHCGPQWVTRQWGVGCTALNAFDIVLASILGKAECQQRRCEGDSPSLAVNEL